MSNEHNTAETDAKGGDARPAIGDTRVKLTFSGGGWVLVVLAFLCVALVAWAVAPALMRASDRPPGDGKDIESYGFDLSNLKVDRSLIAPVLLTRDMVPVMDDPTYMSANEVKALTGRDKYLVSSDEVIGVTINGESRAYPIMLLNVHDIINDTLGGTPIAVTYYWPSDSVVVFDRRYKSETLQFGISGLVYQSNTLMYDRRPEMKNESLWSQLGAQAVSGPMAGLYLRQIQYQWVTWDMWLAEHPDTTVVKRNPSMLARYPDAKPTEYLMDPNRLPSSPYSPLPENDPIPPKTKIIAVKDGDVIVAYTFDWLKEKAGGWHTVEAPHAVAVVQFVLDDMGQHALVTTNPPRATIDITQSYWFAWHAMYPNTRIGTQTMKEWKEQRQLQDSGG